ncbi:hypothetical protein HK098_004202 [Nowakowskiella sp. JEL0407]|nr:hypothetical protein HK098_004202 [Nowakowskiella sp. JEL0407]
MFWRFGFHTASPIDGLLEKDNLTLFELLEEEDLLQECKAQNSKLIDFLCKPEILSQLLSLITAEIADDSKKFKFPFLASEILCCEIFRICDAVISNTALLTSFWGYLDQKELNPLIASYFTKVNSVFLQKKTADMVTFIKAQPNIVKKLLNHVSTSAIADLLLKLITVEELAEGVGIVDWLSSEGLIPLLISQLDPTLDTEVHNTASQTILDIIAVSYQNIAPPDQMAPPDALMNMPVGGNKLVQELKSYKIQLQLVNYMLQPDAPSATNTLINGINIIIELIRRYCSDIEQAEYLHHQYQVAVQQNQLQHGLPPPSPEKLVILATDLNDLLRVIALRLGDFAVLLSSPRSPLPVVEGKPPPLGNERLKTCELFAEVLHLQYLFTSSPLFERLIGSVEDGEGSAGSDPATPKANKNGTLEQKKTTVAEELVTVTQKFVTAGIMPICLDLFFNFPWNNFLHSVVYDMVAKVFNTYSFTSTVTMTRDYDTAEVPRGVWIVEERMRQAKEGVKQLVLATFIDGQLTSRITDAQRLNDYEVEQPKGVRLGYMGHLTYIADEVVKLVEKCLEDFGDDLKACTNTEDWNEYVSGVLRETKERDRQPLGGVRPHGTQQMGLQPGLAVGGNLVLDEADTGVRGVVISDENRTQEDGEARGEVYVSDGDVASDQFARYLVQQIVNDVPDRFLSGEGDDEEVDRAWMGEFASKDNEFDNFGISQTAQLNLPRTSSDDSEPDPFDTAELTKNLPSDNPASQIQGWADFSVFSSGGSVNNNNTVEDDGSPPMDEVYLPASPGKPKST